MKAAIPAGDQAAVNKLLKSVSAPGVSRMTNTVIRIDKASTNLGIRASIIANNFGTCN